MRYQCLSQVQTPQPQPENELKNWYINTGWWFVISKIHRLSKKLYHRASYFDICDGKGEEREQRKDCNEQLLPEFLQSSPCWGTWTENTSRSGASKDSGLRISLSQRLIWSSLVSDGPWIRGTSFSLTPSPEPKWQELTNENVFKIWRIQKIEKQEMVLNSLKV